MRKPSSFWQFPALGQPRRKVRRVAKPAARRLRCEQLEARNLLAADGWFNMDYPMDVNDDGNTTPVDAVLIANLLLANDGEPVMLSGGNSGGFYLDVNNDGQVGMADFTAVANAVGGGNGGDAGAGNAYQTNATTSPSTPAGSGSSTTTSMSSSGSGGGGGGTGSGSTPASTCATTPGWRDAYGQIAVNGSYRNESDGAAFYLERYGSTSLGCGVQVTFHTEDGSAKHTGTGVGESDYTATSGSVIFTNDMILRMIPIAVADDDVVEPHESIKLVIDSITPIDGTVMNGLTVYYPPDYSTNPPIQDPGAGKATILNDDSAEVIFSVQYLDASLSPTDVNGNPIDNKEGKLGESKIARVTATLSKPVVGTVSVDYELNPSWDARPSQADGDFAMTDGILSIPGAVFDSTSGTWIGGSAFFDVTINGDDKVEQDEVIEIDFSNLDAGGLPVSFAKYLDIYGVPHDIDDIDIRIANDDQATVSFVGPAFSAAEEKGEIVFQLRLDREVDVPVTLDFSSVAGSADAGSDYASASGSHVTFSGGAGEVQTLSVTIYNDEIVEADEDFTVNILQVNASGRDVTAGSISTATGKILNVEDEADISIVDSHLPWPLNWELERDTVNTDYEFYVRLSRQVDAAVTVYYTTQDATATAGLDYIAKTSAIVIPAFTPTDSNNNVVKITILGDTVNEWDETFKVKVTGDDDGGGGGRKVEGFPDATGTIFDDD